MIKSLLLVAAGGATGSAARFLLQKLLNTEGFFWGTIVVNLCGCLLIGVLWAFSERSLSPDMRLLLMTGLCGGFTTLSAFSFEGNILLQDGRVGVFFLYAAATFLGGLLATFGGYKIFS